MEPVHFFAQFPIVIEELAHFLSWNKEHIQSAKLSSLTFFELEVALEEVFVNVVGYSGLTSRDVLKEELHISGHSICFILEDQGLAFNPLDNIPKVDKHQAAKERKIGGLGIFLVNEIMDQISYERRGSYNRLTLIKHLN